MQATHLQIASRLFGRCVYSSFFRPLLVTSFIPLASTSVPPYLHFCFVSSVARLCLLLLAACDISPYIDESSAHFILRNAERQKSSAVISKSFSNDSYFINY